jgi:hypothetical protein
MKNINLLSNNTPVFIVLTGVEFQRMLIRVDSIQRVTDEKGSDGNYKRTILTHIVREGYTITEIKETAESVESLIHQAVQDDYFDRTGIAH